VYRRGKGLEVTGRVALRGTELIFAGLLQVEGRAIPLRADPPNVNVELWGGTNTYAVTFGLGFEDTQQGPIDLEGRPLDGPRTVVLVRSPTDPAWYAVVNEYDAEAKIERNATVGFTFKDEQGDLTLAVAGRKPQLFRVSRKEIDRALPGVKGAAGAGTVVLDTRASPVLFRSLEITGMLRAGWLESVRGAEADAAFEVLCADRGPPPATPGERP
jgi:hypothetical protein